MQHALYACQRDRCFVLAQRVGFKCDRHKERFINHFVGQLDQIRGYQIAFPEFERPTAYRSLISECAENEAPVRFQIIVDEKLAAAFERQVIAVNEIFVKAVALFVDVVDFVVVLAIDHNHHVRQGVRRVRIVRDG